MLRDVTVREVMNGDYVGVSESDGLVESVELLLSENADVGVVLRGDEPVGAVSESDALRAFVDADDPASTAVGEAMTADVPTIPPDGGLQEARDRMTSLDTGWLVVSEGDHPLGVVTERDLLAGSTIGRERGAGEDREGESTMMTPTATAAGVDAESASEDAFEDQGICEVCGALSADLVAFNGQLRCADCRDV